MSNETGPVEDKSLLKAFKELEELEQRLSTIRTRIDQLHKEEEELTHSSTDEHRLEG